MKLKLKISGYIIKRRMLDSLNYLMVLTTSVVVPSFLAFSKILWKLGKKSLAFKIQAKTFRAFSQANKSHFKNLIKFLEENDLLEFLTSHVENTPIYPQTKKFNEDPTKLFEGNIIVLSRYESSEKKGLLVIKYSHYFPLFLKLFRAQEISQRYQIVLEPGWSGYFDQDIFSMLLLNTDILIMTPECHDLNFLKQNFSQLQPISIGSNWWVDHKHFTNLESPKDIDLLVVSGWADFKRHFEILKAVSDIAKRKKDFKVFFAGYPVDKDKKFIFDLIEYYGLTDNVEVAEWLEPAEMVKLYNRSKVSLVWSKFEGINRAIAESGFCNTPFILRKGFNFGESYNFVNSETGIYAEPSNLAYSIESMSENYLNFQPRNWFIKNQTPELALTLISEITKASINKDLTLKINTLHGMQYTSKTKTDFTADYEFIATCIKELKS